MKEKKPSTGRKRIITVCIILASMFAVLLLFDITLESGILESPANEDAGTAEPIFFFNPDYDFDIFTDEAYLDLDRSLHFSDDGGTSVAVLTNDNAYNSAHRTARFFRDYFDSVIMGDHERYNTLFTSEYLKKNGTKDRFTMQMIYNMEAVMLRSEDLDNGTTLYEFEVRYAIRRNNGTFRNDLESGVTRPQIYVLSEDPDTGTILIASISEMKQKSGRNLPIS